MAGVDLGGVLAAAPSDLQSRAKQQQFTVQRFVVSGKRFYDLTCESFS
jgi:hypothetical protein